MKTFLFTAKLREYLAEGNRKALREFCASAPPALVAEHLSALHADEIHRIIENAQPLTRAEIFSHLDNLIQVKITELMSREELAQLVTDMAPDDRVDLLKQLSDEDRESLLREVARAEREDIRRLSLYPEGTSGAAMTSDYAVLMPGITAREAIERLRYEAPDKETIYYAYIVDDQRKLIGFVSLKDLILAKPDKLVSEIMNRNIIMAQAMDDQEDAAHKIRKYDLIALPVVNEEGALLGIITHDDAIDIITQEHTEDMEKLMAIAGSHEAGVYLKTPALVHFKNRAWWIVGLAALGLVSGLIIHSFENTLMHMMILALYMPMVADTGGNTGSQSATVIVRALALKEISFGDIFRILLKELKISMMLAVVLGVIAWGKVMFLSRGSEIPSGFSLSMIGLTIAAALGMQVVTATLIGALLPLCASRLKLDPAVVASPALTTVVDITGLLIYFSMAKALLGI